MHEQEDDEVVTKDQFIIGDLVDALLTEPDRIKKDFLRMEGKIPSSSFVNLTDKLMEVLEEASYDTNQEYQLKDALKSAQQRAEFQKAWGIDAVFNNFNKHCLDYFKIVNTAKKEGKLLYTEEQEQRAEKLKDTLVNGEYTARFFKDSYESFNQVEFYWEMFGMKFKVKLDKVLADHETKEIIPTDIKTYSGNFIKSYYDYFYWLQGIIYKIPLLLYKEKCTQPQLFPEKLDLEVNEQNKKLLSLIEQGYNITTSNFIFLTVDKTERNPPIPFIHALSPMDTMYNISLYRKDQGVNLQYPGWTGVCKNLWRHIQEDQWQYPIELIENKVIKL